MTNPYAYKPLSTEGFRELLGDLVPPAPPRRRGTPARTRRSSADTSSTSWHPKEWRGRKFVTIKELAATLGVNRNTVTQALDKAPEARYTIGRRVLIRKDMLDKVVKP